MWKIVRKVFPKNNETLPFAKKDFDGNLISSQKDLKSLYHNTFKTRLRHRPMKPGLEDLKCLKEELCMKRIKASNLRQSEPWKLEDLLSVLSKSKMINLEILTD